MGWCFNPMPVPELIRHCAEIGIEAIEGIDRKFYPDAQKAGLKISLVSSHGFGTGPVDPKNHASCIEKLREAIDVAVQFQSPSVITFTGMRVDGWMMLRPKKTAFGAGKKLFHTPKKRM